MPLFICIVFAPLLIALLVALKASGRKRVLAWCVFALLALPLSVGGAGGPPCHAQKNQMPYNLS